jgi:hypothetical protein
MGRLIRGRKYAAGLLPEKEEKKAEQDELEETKTKRALAQRTIIASTRFPAAGINMADVPPTREPATSYGDGPVPLLDLYKTALDEYHFEVKLNAERMIQYLALSAAVLSAGVGLLKFGPSGRSTAFFVGIIFFCGALIAALGALAVRRGHEYYRRTIYRKTLIENLLGLHKPIPNHPRATLAVITTRGQAEVNEILDHPDAWLGRRTPLGTITTTAIVVFGLLALSNIAAIIVLFWQYRHGQLP